MQVYETPKKGLHVYKRLIGYTLRYKLVFFFAIFQGRLTYKLENYDNYIKTKDQKTLSETLEGGDFEVIKEGDEGFDEITEIEKTALVLPVGIVVAALESIGLRNVLAQKGVANYFLKRAIGKKVAKRMKLKYFIEYILILIMIKKIQIIV